RQPADPARRRGRPRRGGVALAQLLPRLHPRDRRLLALGPLADAPTAPPRPVLPRGGLAARGDNRALRGPRRRAHPRDVRDTGPAPDLTVPIAAYHAELAAYLALRRAVALHDVGVAGRELVLFAEDELADAQVGYGVDADGDDLSTDAPGGWQPAWLVVAHQEESGTPL